MPQTQFLVNGTLEDAIDVLSKRSVDIRSLGAPRLSRTYFDKTAFLGELGKTISEGWKNLDQAGKDALIGAGIGAGVGGIASGFDDEEERSTFGSMVRGGIAGGAVGGGIGLLRKYWDRQVGPLDTPDPDALGDNEFWMPIMGADGKMVTKGQKMTWNDEGITEAAKKRGISPEAVKDELAAEMEGMKDSDLDMPGWVSDKISDGLVSLDKGGLAAGGVVAGIDNQYERMRRRHFEKAMPTTYTPGNVKQFRQSLLEELNNTQQEMRAPQAVQQIPQTTASGTTSTVPKNVATGPEVLVESFKNSTQSPTEWKKVFDSEELTRLAAEGKIDEFKALAGTKNLPIIAASERGALEAHLSVINDLSTQQAVSRAGTHGPKALPSWQGKARTPWLLPGQKLPWFDRHGSKNPFKWRGGLGLGETVRPKNWQFGVKSLLTPGQMVPKLGPRMWGKGLRKGLLPLMAYQMFNQPTRTDTDRLQEAMNKLEPFLKPVGGGGGAPPATSDAPPATTDNPVRPSSVPM